MTENKMPIFIIHDPKRTDRMALIEEEINMQRIDKGRVIFVDAVKNNEPKLGISEAHKNAIRQAKQLNLRYAIVLEDDVCFACTGAFGYLEKILEIFETIGFDYDAFIAGYSSRRIADGLKDHQYVQLTSFSGMHCYVMHSRFYDSFLNEEITDHVDRQMCRINNHKAFIFGHNKNFAIQYPGYSDQKGKWVNYAEIWAKTSLLTLADIQ